MKILPQFTCFSLLIFAVTGCNGIKASTDNATLSPGLQFDSKGKLTDAPDVSVPVWSSGGLKPKPVDVTPEKNQKE